MGLIKNHNGRNYAHAQDSNAYNLLELKFNLTYKNVHWIVLKGNSMGPTKIHNG